MRLKVGRGGGNPCPEKSSFSQHARLGVNLLEGDVSNRGSGWGGGEREEVGPPLGSLLCSCCRKGLNIQSGVWWWGDGQACSVRNNE